MEIHYKLKEGGAEAPPYLFFSFFITVPFGAITFVIVPVFFIIFTSETFPVYHSYLRHFLSRDIFSPSLRIFLNIK